MSAPSGSPADLADLLDDHEVLGELGRGGSAVVYRAVDRTLGRDVAVKVVHPRAATRDDDAVARLAREARTVAQLEHPNIVPVYAVRRLRGGGLALIMPLVAGGTLKTAVHDAGPLPPDRVERVLRDVATALAYAHAHGVVHRDVKPENIFFDQRTGRALLADFGIARSEAADAMTMTGTAVGTPFYMSPEQVSGGAIDGRSDLYSLGLAAWEALTGRRPWDGESLYSVVYKQRHETLPPIEALRSGVPRRLQYVVERMLQKQPGARWAGADALLSVLTHSVLPSDYERWQRALPSRVARFREAEAAHGATAAADDLSAPSAATVRFAPGQTPDQPTVPGVSSAARRAGAIHATAVRESTRPWVPASSPTAAPNRVTTPDVLPPTSELSPALTNAASDGFVTRPAAVRYADLVEPSWESSADAVQLPPVPRFRRVRGAMLGMGAVSLAAAGTFAAQHRTGPLLGLVPGPTEPTAARARVADLGGVSRSSLSAREARDRTVMPAPSNGRTLAAGGRHSCALLPSGRAYCWGANDRGQLGDGGGPLSHTVPVGVTGDFTFVALTAGSAHSCAVTRSGDAYCWGANGDGQLGDATTVRRNAPVRVAGPYTYTAISAGAAHTCAVTADGAARCWGSNGHGQLGTGSTERRSVPTPVRLNRAIRQIAAGGEHTCAVTVDRALFCWGANSDGQLGSGPAGDDARGPREVALPAPVAQVSLGLAHTCATGSDGRLWCWGRNAAGQLGSGTRASRPEPTDVPTGVGPVAVVAAGYASTCAVGTQGTVACWGRDTRSTLGADRPSFRTRPAVVRLPTGVAPNAAVVGAAHACVQTAGGPVYCWGHGTDGQLGDASAVSHTDPVAVRFPILAGRSGGPPGRTTAQAN